ncbi:MAG: glycosyltransferase [Calditrichaeota bacterium]|nr:glycosyltransferase [Calditrichota bacterium]MCB9366005.1 glycosyltransferase [Calditrichota bacterium]MCB9391869.1 glycosyltransferase [Calditrichota bacterium]
MPDFVVVQLARLGDLLQTRPLLQTLRESDAEARVWLIYDDRYNDLVRRFPEVTGHIPISIGSLVANSRMDTNLPEAIRYLSELLRGLPVAECLYNLTNHTAAQRLAGLVPAAQRTGYGFLESETLSARMWNQPDDVEPTHAEPVHVADIWKSLAGKERRSADYCPLVSLADSRTRSRTVLIADAGSPERSLTRQTLQRIVCALRSAGESEIILIGARSAASSIEGANDLRGKTNLNELVKLLESAQNAIGPDTGALHLAAALGCRTLGLYFAGADPRRTGPYTKETVCLHWSHDDRLLTDSHFLDLLAGWLSVKKIRTQDGVSVLLPEFRGTQLHFEKQTTCALEGADRAEGVSVVISERGQVHYTDILLAILEEAVLEFEYEVIVVSSGLSAADVKHASSRSRVSPVISTRPLSFAEANNTGAKAAKMNWLLLLNDDCEPTAQTLNNLYHRRRTQKVVAPRLTYWDGVSQSEGIYLSEGGLVEKSALSDSLLHGEPVAISAAAMLIKKSDFDLLNGFDTSFVNGYEDIDLCLRAGEHNIGVEVDTHSLTHFRGSSPGRFDRDYDNESLLFRRWPKVRPKDSGKSKRQPPNVPLLLISDCAEAEAGPCLRWSAPLQRCGLKVNRDFGWFDTTERSPVELAQALRSAEHALVFRSVGTTEHFAELKGWKFEQQGTLLFDCDDLLIGRFRPGSPRANERSHYESLVRQVLDISDIIVAPSMRLHNLHQTRPQSRYVIETVPISEHFTPAKRGLDQGTFRIGFAAGSAHLTDLAMIAPEIERILNDFPNVMFYWWGTTPPMFAFHPQVRRGGTWLKNYVQHLTRLHRAPIDLWLVPLADSIHNSLRSPVKVFEHIGSGQRALFSNVTPYNDTISDAQEVLVDNRPGHWYSAIRNAIEMRDHSVESAELKTLRASLVTRSTELTPYRSLLRSLGVKRSEVAEDTLLCPA